MNRKQVVIPAVVALVLAGGGAGAWLYQQDAAKDAAARDVLRAYAQGWRTADFAAVPFADAGAAATFGKATAGLGAGAPSVELGGVSRDGDRATADLTVTWTLPGSVPWTYDVQPSAVQQGGRWRIAAPSIGSYWNRDLPAGATMTATRTTATRGNLLDRNGKALMPLGTVYPVQLDPARATVAVATTLEGITDTKKGTLVAKLQAAQKAGSKAPIPVITYREGDFEARRQVLDSLTGVIYPKTQQPLATDREFGQPLLGSYGEVTAEMVKDSKGRYIAGDRAGTSGLQRVYDTRLAGLPGVQVSTSTGAKLFDKPAVAGEDVALTLDPTVQAAAEKALAGTGEIPSALVAIQVSTGKVLAVANRPWSGFNRALTGRFPPGSVFKIASTYALLGSGKVSPSEAVSCPTTATIDGRAFKNFEGESLGSPTFATDFAHSCNTAFVQLSTRLGDGDLNAAASGLGIGAGWAKGFGVPETFDGSVPQNNGKTDKAAAMIGQGRNLVSPLAIATMTASVAHGSLRPPTLITDPAPEGTPVAEGPLDGSVVTTLRQLMRSVVTSGTGTALAGAPGGPVHGKTGTAEFGNAVPPQTHAWFTGYQGDLAFAVLVERGRSGGTVAAPIAEAFLQNVNG